MHPIMNFSTIQLYQSIKSMVVNNERSTDSKERKENKVENNYINAASFLGHRVLRAGFLFLRSLPGNK